MYNSYFKNAEPVSTDLGMIVRLVTPTTPIPVDPSGGTSGGSTACATTSVALSGANQTGLASNTSRKGASFFNDSTNYVYVKMGATASTTSFQVRLDPYAYLEVPFNYKGQIDLISSGASGSVRVGEYT